jgi:asparagine synthase (glutamine-hydrolysing)
MGGQGFKAVLVGEGGDELFGGYRRHFQLLQTENLLTHRFGMFLDNALHWSESSTHVKPLAKSMMQKIKSVLRQTFLSAYHGVLQNEKYERSTEYINLPRVLSKRGYFPRTLTEALYDEITSTSIPYWVRTNDRARMGIPIEGRSPFLDHRVVELALTLPATYLIRHGWHKWILRKAFQNSLPEEVVWRKQKLGFPYPFKRFMLDSPPSIRTLFQELRNPYVDLPSFQRFANDPTNIQRNEWEAHTGCWRMISFLLWYELFVNRNENLFSKIQQEHRVNYIGDSFVPKFLYSSTAPQLH